MHLGLCHLQGRLRENARVLAPAHPKPSSYVCLRCEPVDGRSGFPLCLCFGDNSSRLSGPAGYQVYDLWRLVLAGAHSESRSRGLLVCFMRGIPISLFYTFCFLHLLDVSFASLSSVLCVVLKTHNRMAACLNSLVTLQFRNAMFNYFTGIYGLGNNLYFLSMTRI